MLTQTSDLLDSSNTLYIEWEITQKCNYRCSYCSAYDILGKNELSWNKKKFILKEIFKSKYNILLYLLGGEPTISKDYFNILDYFEELNQNNKAKLFISTNFSQSPNFYKKHKFYNNVIHWLSIHPEYTFKKIDELEIKINILKDRNFKFIFAPMIYPDEKYLALYDKFIELSKNKNLIYYPQIVVKYSDHYIPSNINFYNKYKYLFNNEYQELNKNNIKIKYSDIFLNNDYNRKNWKCWYSYFEIYWNGTFSSRCLDLNNSFDKLLNYFKYFEIKPIKCKRNFCDDYTLIHMKKEYYD